MSHPIVHIEISANNLKEASKFYTTVFGWKTEDFPEMNYTTFATSSEKGALGGGFNPVQENNPAGTVLVYINADDIPATLKAIEANGGKTLSPEMEIPGVGWFATFSDPTGNTMALFKTIPMQE